MKKLFYITYWWKKGNESGFNHYFHEMSGEMTAKKIIEFHNQLQQWKQFDECSITGWQEVEAE